MKDQGVLVYGLHNGEPPSQLQPFIEAAGLTFPVLDDAGTLGAFAYPPGTGYPYPRDVIVDKHGVVRSIKQSFSVGEAEALIELLLAEP